MRKDDDQNERKPGEVPNGELSGPYARDTGGPDDYAREGGFSGAGGRNDYARETIEAVPDSEEQSPLPERKNE